MDMVDNSDPPGNRVKADPRLVLQSHLYCQVAGLLCYGAESAVRGCGTAAVVARTNVALRLVFPLLDNTSATVELAQLW